MKPSDAIWALVSGFPRAKREVRWLVMLQAFVDDSGSEPQDPIFVLGGFVAPAEKWASFADAWQSTLDKKPGLSYFKMAEANAMREQFDKHRGWTEPLRDIRVLELAKLVANFASYGAYAYLRHSDFNTHIASVPLPERRLASDRPYAFLAAQIATVFDKFNDTGQRIDLFFDTQIGFDVELPQWWPILNKYLGPSYVTPPTFRDEKEVLPLQAADLLAWQARKRQKQNAALWFPSSAAMYELRRIPIYSIEITKAKLAQIGGAILGNVAAFAAVNPDVTLLSASRTSRRRSRNLIKIRASSSSPDAGH